MILGNITNNVLVRDSLVEVLVVDGELDDRQILVVLAAHVVHEVGVVQTEVVDGSVVRGELGALDLLDGEVLTDVCTNGSISEVRVEEELVDDLESKTINII